MKALLRRGPWLTLLLALLAAALPALRASKGVTAYSCERRAPAAATATGTPTTMPAPASNEL